jgi:hypothetical protein
VLHIAEASFFPSPVDCQRPTIQRANGPTIQRSKESRLETAGRKAGQQACCAVFTRPFERLSLDRWTVGSLDRWKLTLINMLTFRH